MDEYEQSSGYWQHPNNNKNNPENETAFYGFKKSQNVNHVNYNEQFTDVNFVFPTQNNVA